MIFITEEPEVINITSTPKVVHTVDEEREQKMMMIINIVQYTILALVVANVCAFLYYFRRRLCRRLRRGRREDNDSGVDTVEFSVEDGVVNLGLVDNELYFPMRDGATRFTIRCDEAWEIRREK